MGALLTAKQWERAAIVYAFTRPGGKGIKSSDTVDLALLPHEFAALGIRGLTRPQTVAEYRNAWKAAIDDGKASEVAPGDNVPLPTIAWKDVFGEPTRDVQGRVFRSVLADPEQFSEALRDQPESTRHLVDRVMHTPAVRVPVEHRLAEPIETREVRLSAEPTKRDFATDLTYGVNLLVPVLRAIQRGEWAPSTAHMLLLGSLAALIGQAAEADTEPQEDLFAEIQKHLSEAAAT